MKKRVLFHLGSNNAFTLVEVLISMVVIGIMGVLIVTTMTSSWKKSTFSDRELIAGHIIERSLEEMRMEIDRDASSNFPPTGNTITENGVTLTWTISDATRPTDGGTLSNVRKCDFVARWGKAKGDTLRVSTYLSRMF
jgi:prepilin-type N-terminal cleavage/methylation domain-containing protein